MPLSDRSHPPPPTGTQNIHANVAISHTVELGPATLALLGKLVDAGTQQKIDALTKTVKDLVTGKLKPSAEALQDAIADQPTSKKE